MSGVSNQKQPELIKAKQSFCLTNMSLTSLTGCALGASAILWLCILVVL